MKNLVSVYRTIILLFSALVLCNPTNADNPSSKKVRPIIIVGNKMSPPYSFLDEEGNPTGFNVELTHEIMKKINRPYVIKLMSWQACMDSLRTNKADLIVGMKYNNHRALEFKFGPILNYNYEYAIYRKGGKPISSINELNGKIIVVEKKSNSEELMHDNNIKTAKTIRVKNIETGLYLLSKGKYDIALFPRGESKYVIEKYKMTNLTMSNLDLAALEDCIVGNNEKLVTETDNAVFKLKEDGIYDNIYDKWLADKHSRVSRIIYFGLGLLALFSIILFAFNCLLRKKVKKAEELLSQNNKRLKLAIHASGVKVWGYEVDQKRFFNIEGNIFPEKGIELKDLLVMLHPDDQDSFEKTLYDISQDMIPDKPLYFRIDYSQMKQWKYIEIEYAAVHDSNGKVIRIIGARKDISHLIEIQHKLENEKEKAIQADKLKSMFLANMSHEIRTPLNAILGFSSLLQDTESREERTEYMNIIKTNSDSLLQLINDILDLSKIESGIIEFQPEKFNITTVFNEMNLYFRQRIINPEVKLICSCPYQQCDIFMDKSRLVQILSNLVTNAIKYTNKGHIEMGYKPTLEGILIYVEDTGNGIAPENIEKIFNRFEKLESFVQGIGLGLSICKSLIEKLNGHIEVTSQLNKGTTFTIYIPCKAEFSETEDSH